MTVGISLWFHINALLEFMPPPDQTGSSQPVLRSPVNYQTCEHDILKIMNRF